MKTETMTQEWFSIHGYEEYYQINTSGDVRSIARPLKRFANGGTLLKPRIIKQQISTTGYLIVDMCIDGKTSHKQVHRLLAQTFIPNLGGLPEVNHIDGNKINNSLSNLEWVSRERNMQHAYDAGLNKKQRAVLQLSIEGEAIAEHNSAYRASRDTNTNRGSICLCCRGKLRKAGGYLWKYKNE